MAFSINQVRHLFVAKTPKDANAAVTAVGDLAPYGVAGQYLYFKHYGYGGEVSTDKIDVQNILYAKRTSGDSLKTKLYKHTLTVTTAVAGQVYTVKVFAKYYIGIGEQDTVTRVATYRAKSGDTAANIAAGLRKSLRGVLGFQKSEASAEASATDTANADLYKEQIFTVTGTGAAVIITELEPYWELGKFPAGHVTRIPENGVFLMDINDASGIATNAWGSVVYAVASTLDDASKKLADLEDFCMGARGDEYRGMGYPRNITTKYQVDVEEDYDIIDIHYAYVGSNESVQKSEKDLTILVPQDDAEDLVEAINTLTGFGETDPRYLETDETDGSS